MEWFDSRKSGEIINKASQEKLFKTFNHTISKDETMEKLLIHDETVFLHKSCVGSKKVVLFHHLVKIGGSIYDDSSVRFGFIHGLGEHTAFPMIPDLETLGERYVGRAIPVPTLGQIFGVSNVEDVDRLADSATSYKPRNFIPVPPFLMNTI